VLSSPVLHEHVSSVRVQLSDAWSRDVEVANDNELAVQQCQLVEQVGQLIDDTLADFSRVLVTLPTVTRVVNFNNNFLLFCTSDS